MGLSVRMAPSPEWRLCIFVSPPASWPPGPPPSPGWLWLRSLQRSHCPAWCMLRRAAHLSQTGPPPACHLAEHSLMNRTSFVGSPRGYPSPYSQYVVLETQGPPVPGCAPSR